MPGITYVQSNVAYYGVAGSGGNLPCAFLSANIKGNIGIAWIVTDDSTTTSGITDSNGNTWYQLPGLYTNLGNSEFWVCPSLNHGANTVTAAGLTGYTTGSPDLIVAEYLPPPCPLGSVGIQAFIPDPGGDYYYPQLYATSQYQVSQGAWYHTLIAGIKCGTSGSSGTSRTWAMIPDPSQIAYGLRIQYNEPTGTSTGALADCTVPYPTTDNSINFTYTPSTPAVNAGETKIVMLLISTLA